MAGRKPSGHPICAAGGTATSQKVVIAFALNHPDAADRFVGSIMLSADAVVLMLLAQRTSFERVVRPVWMFDSFAALPHSRPKARVAVVIVYHR
jgi:hypothetical protein